MATLTDSRLVQFFRTGADKPPLDLDERKLKRKFLVDRMSVFLAITFGYGVYYVGRLNFAVAKPDMLDHKVLSATEMGIIGSALLFAYAIGKLTNGFLADRVNVRKFMSAGLLIVAAINLVLGFTTMFFTFAVLWGINGWFQSMGAPSSIVSLANWFSPRERGTWYGLWCISHDIGGGILTIISALLVTTLGWRWGFWAPGILCGMTAVTLMFTLKDRPQTYGLPSVAEFRNDPSPIAKKSDNVNKLQIGVLTNPAIWTLGLSSALMYMTRYGMYGWAILYLHKGRGYTLTETGLMTFLFYVASVVGEAASGLISDIFFKANRNVPCLIFGVLETVCLAAFLLIPDGNRLLDYSLMAGIGLALGVLVSFLGGLMAVDIVPPRAAGAAAGVVGMFSYVGAGIQDVLSGLLIDLGKTQTSTVLSVYPKAFADFCGDLGINIAKAMPHGIFDRTYFVTHTEISYKFEPVLLFWTIAGGLSVIAALFVWNAGKRARGEA